MRNVLIVEDSKAIRSMIRVALEEQGSYFVVEATNGFEALKALPTRDFDLIVTDINMPDINGLELINFVKSNPAYRTIPLVIVSTEKSEEDQKRGLALGAAGYVVKPFKKEDLLAAVAAAIGKT
ncbi:MAG: two-component system response regulator [Nitrospirae bacterium GWC2_57_13]|jgi:two-component system, chemotaxis family, chemotaxis protein CheY|nr:MAG: two-component system response regulator [Nitrospirae bacterium GWC2_57_13]HAS54197.1 response regulator [Nitrospiraceae bacterium]